MEKEKELQILYFEASIQLFQKDGKSRLRGKFIGVGTSYAAVKEFIAGKLKEKYPDHICKITMLPMRGISGMFIENLAENEVAKKALSDQVAASAPADEAPLKEEKPKKRKPKKVVTIIDD